MTTIAIAIPSVWKLDSWQHEGDSGSRPQGRLPYGLDGLSQYGTVLEHASRRLPPLQSADRKKLIAWDEISFSQRGRVGRGWETFSGVIWGDEHVSTWRERYQVMRRRHALLGADGLWCLSAAQLPALREWLGPSCPPIFPLQFGIDTAFFTPGPAETSNSPVFVSVGNDRDRDIDLLYRTFRRIKEALPRAKFLIQTRSSLTPPEDSTVRASLSHAELRRWYRSADLCLIACRPNAHVSGMTVCLESAACGTPTLITPSLGMDEYVYEGVNGFISPSRSAEDLAERAIGIMTGEHELAMARATARHIVLEKFSQSRMVHDLARLTGIDKGEPASCD